MFRQNNGLTDQDYAAIGKLVICFSLLEKELFSIICALIELEEAENPSDDGLGVRQISVGKDAFGPRVKKLLKLYSKRFGEDTPYPSLRSSLELCQPIRDQIVHGIWTLSPSGKLKCEFMSRTGIKSGHIIDVLLRSRSELLQMASDCMGLVTEIGDLEQEILANK